MRGATASVGDEQRLIAEAGKRNGFSWRSPGGPVFQTPLLLIFLLAILAPGDILDRYAAGRHFAQAVRSRLLEISPLLDIGRFADSTAYPQVALLVCALHWAWLPFSVLISAGIFEYARAREKYVVWRHIRGDDGRIKWKDLGICLAGAGFSVPTVIILTMVPGDWSLAAGLTTESRLGLGLMMWAGFSVCGVMLGLFYPVLRMFVDINLRGK